MTMRMSIPTEKRAPAPSLADRSMAWSRLFLIEMRRSPAIFTALAIAAVTAWLIWDQLPVGVVRWREVSDFSSHAMLPASGIAAAIAAFLAGRDQRLRLEDQLAQTSLGTPRRDVVAMFAAVAWCLIGYLVIVAGFFLYAAREATWGGPAWALVGLTAVTIVLGISLGWLVGVIFRNRFSPLIAFVLMIGLNAAYSLTADLRRTPIQQIDGGTSFSIHESRIRVLSPYELLDLHDLGFIMIPAFAWILGISVLLASAAWWYRHRRIASLVSLSVAAMVSGVSAADLLANDPHTGPAHWRTARAYVEPVCETRLQGAISVCLHPEDTVLLDDVAGTVERLMSPLAGIPGVPVRFENQSQQQDTNTIYLYVHDAQDLEFHVTTTVLRELMHDQNGQWMQQTGSAQYVVLAWLLQQAGISRQEASEMHYLRPLPLVQATDDAIAMGVTDPMELNRFFETNTSQGDVSAFEAEIDAAIARCVALPEAERRTWLEENWNDLRAGNLTLEDLP